GNYFKTTFRNLWKNKAYSFLNIAGLPIGIACATLIFLWADIFIRRDIGSIDRGAYRQFPGNQNSDS
ncbi:MAG TPA: hypothetical protein VIU45_00160, partial [Chitinophagaceae bacterium]